MIAKSVVLCKSTPSGVFVPCPVCRSGKLLRLYPETEAVCVPLYCRKCKRESVVDIQAGDKFDRVTLRKAGVRFGIPDRYQGEQNASSLRL